MHLLSRFIFCSVLSLFAVTCLALELSTSAIPANLKETYNKRQSAPQSCIKSVNKYISDLEKKEQATTQPSENTTIRVPKKPFSSYAPIQLLASCYIELEDYQSSLSLLMPLLKNPSVSADEIRTLIIIASDIPEQERINLGDKTLINMMQNSLEVLPKKGNRDLINNLNLAIAQLAISTHQYQLANQALTRVKQSIKKHKNDKLLAWLNFYLGLYYNELNQQQLAVSHLRTANNMADKQQLIKLSSLVKESLANLYQQKHRYRRAIDFASQRVELLLETENYVQQAESLIKLAVLKRQNKEFNQSFIYLFNALELIEKKHKWWLANTYLELGKTYASTPYDFKKNLLLAQKYLQNARLHFNKLGKLEQETGTLLLLAQLNISNNDTSLAILQLEHVLELAGEEFPELSVQAFELLALSYELAGDHQQANFHFKNFHTLQNEIKEHLFTLQQLKIDEQFHLIEQTQQQIELETKNNQLLLKNKRFRNLAHTALVLVLIALVIFLYLLRRNKKLQLKNQQLQNKMQTHPRTQLPLHQVQLEQQDPSLQDQHNPLYYALVHIPFLSNLNESKGLFNAEQIEQELGLALQNAFNDETQVSQVKDNQLLFISKQENHGNAKAFAEVIADFFDSFAQQHHLDGKVASGIVAFPFLNNVSRAIAPERMLNLTSLALFGACQLRKDISESTWLELYAIEKIQPAFFDGDLWTLGQKGIDKGIVKIKSNQPQITILWPELNH